MRTCIFITDYDRATATCSFLAESPGHLFLQHEEADLGSFLVLGIINGWDMHVFPELAYGDADTARAVLSHDEWIALYHRQERPMKEWRERLQKAAYRLTE